MYVTYVKVIFPDLYFFTINLKRIRSIQWHCLCFLNKYFKFDFMHLNNNLGNGDARYYDELFHRNWIRLFIVYLMIVYQFKSWFTRN